ncbi:MAG: hypothetical protein KC431_27190, partial [Myxococcales bacterium]|nr:hypothetical protein [Myxococcales bacterium]
GGNAAELYVGRRGLFQGVDGQQWDAEIAAVIVNPMSWRELVGRPLRSLGGFVEQQLGRISTQVQLDAKAGVDGQQAPGLAKSLMENTGAIKELVLMGSVSLAALMSTFACMTSALAKIDFLGLVLTTLCGLFSVSVSLLGLGILEINRQNLAFLLEASGWTLTNHEHLVADTRRLRRSAYTRGPQTDA